MEKKEKKVNESSGYLRELNKVKKKGERRQAGRKLESKTQLQ